MEFRKIKQLRESLELKQSRRKLHHGTKSSRYEISTLTHLEYTLYSNIAKMKLKLQIELNQSILIPSLDE